MVQAIKGANATLQCRILGNPPPAVKWVLNGRVIKNRSAPLTAKPGQIYLIQSVATMEGKWKKHNNNKITKQILFSRWDRTQPQPDDNRGDLERPGHLLLCGDQQRRRQREGSHPHLRLPWQRGRHPALGREAVDHRHRRRQRSSAHSHRSSHHPLLLLQVKYFDCDKLEIVTKIGV